MPDQRLERTRKSLSSGYQFLDAGKWWFGWQWMPHTIGSTIRIRMRDLGTIVAPEAAKKLRDFHEATRELP